MSGDPEKDPPICLKCLHFFEGDYGNVCYRPESTVFNPVHGREPIDCKTARQSGQPCGPTGALFEPVAIVREKRVIRLALAFVFGVVGFVLLRLAGVL